MIIVAKNVQTSTQLYQDEIQECKNLFKKYDDTSQFYQKRILTLENGISSKEIELKQLLEEKQILVNERQTVSILMHFNKRFHYLGQSSIKCLSK